MTAIEVLKQRLEHLKSDAIRVSENIESLRISIRYEEDHLEILMSNIVEIEEAIKRLEHDNEPKRKNKKTT